MLQTLRFITAKTLININVETEATLNMNKCRKF